MTGARPLLAAGLALALGCGDKPKPPPYPAPEVSKEGSAVATIGPVTLTTAEIEHRIAQQSPFIKNQMVSLEQRRKFVENEVRMELLAQEGWKKGLYDDPQIKLELKRAIVQRLMRDELQRIQDHLEVTPAEIEEAFNKKVAEYNKPEKIRLSEIVFHASDPNAKRDARKRLESLKAALEEEDKRKNEAAFAEAAKRLSEDAAARTTGGDLSFLSREELSALRGAEIARAMFDDLDVNQMSIVETEGSVVLFKKTGKRRAVVRTLEMVRPQLAAELLAEKKTRLFDEAMVKLEESAGVSIDAHAVESLKVEPSPMPSMQEKADKP